MRNDAEDAPAADLDALIEWADGWAIAVIAGGGIAALTKGTTAVVRAKSAALTGGLGNPVVSTAETAGAAAVSILAIAAPLLCLGGVIIIVVWAVRRLRRIAR